MLSKLLLMLFISVCFVCFFLFTWLIFRFKNFFKFYIVSFSLYLWRNKTYLLIQCLTFDKYLMVVCLLFHKIYLTQQHERNLIAYFYKLKVYIYIIYIYSSIYAYIYIKYIYHIYHIYSQI